ncbi:hypothetical protein HanRHA438_Chr11g0531911 [Helianthus annuus]|nr:hypothetical protein HanIR_Chr11g0560431 [Helianthus annuus]KAJ0873175.1 hypothetical protein HanRHA438_Chr11g0531911 [Helianthus annuus]
MQEIIIVSVLKSLVKMLMIAHLIRQIINLFTSMKNCQLDHEIATFITVPNCLRKRVSNFLNNLISSIACGLDNRTGIMDTI